MSNKSNNIIGKKYGKLTVTGTKRKSLTTEGTDYLCICECGNEVYVYRGNLTTSKTRSCGCLKNRLNGKSNTLLYRKWWSIKERCYKQYHSSYKNYGGKGIKLCNEWFDFNVFYDWSMDNGYTDDLTIERIDSTKDYSPENCEWITLSENVARSNRETIRRKSKFTYIGVDPEGNTHEFSNAQEFGRENNMNGLSIARVARGERKSYLGWKFYFSDTPNI